MNINRVRVYLSQKNNSQIFLLLINYCPFTGLYSGTSRFMEARALLISRCSIASVSKPISFLQEFCIRKWFIGAKNVGMFVWL